MKDLKQKHIMQWESKLKLDERISREGNLFHDYFRRIPFIKLNSLLKQNGINLNDKNFLVAGCGKGTDIYYLKKYFNPKIYATDISKRAVKVSVDSFSDIEGSVEDLEELSFKNNSFDFSFVAASLHHLSKPMLGLYELLRVSKYGVIVIESNDSILTRLAILLRLAHETEEIGNYVFRFSKKDVSKIARSLSFDCSVKRFFAIHKTAKNKFEFFILKLLNASMNAICPCLGNYVVFLIKKRELDE